jgi:hypothetical protein
MYHNGALRHILYCFDWDTYEDKLRARVNRTMSVLIFKSEKLPETDVFDEDLPKPEPEPNNFRTAIDALHVAQDKLAGAKNTCVLERARADGFEHDREKYVAQVMVGFLFFILLVLVGHIGWEFLRIKKVLRSYKRKS